MDFPNPTSRRSAGSSPSPFLAGPAVKKQRGSHAALTESQFLPPRPGKESASVMS